ncbi:hypothetical protein J3Q64DRAFT_1830476 [Phycomyces blakesleeanus]|uniref:MADF domain-containing protein n=1 Tax=Phycomyces blakesleeanus TaxID=4837 RepID=A0ABR3BBD6_PHYBL
MPPKRTSKNAENSNKKLRIKQYKLSGFEEEKKPKKAHGSWNDTKELVLLQEYAHPFPPSLKKGAHKKAWQDIVKSVNDVTPGETELSYDTCRRKMLKLVDIYKNAFEERTVAGSSGANRNRPEVEKAVRKILDKLGLEGRIRAIASGAPGQITNLRQKYRDFIKKTNAEMQEKFSAESSAMAAARPVGSQASPASIEDEEGEEGEENENADEEDENVDENMDEDVDEDVDEVEDEDHPEVGNEVPESQAARHAEVMGVLKQILQKMCDIEEELKKNKKIMIKA